MFQFVVAVSGVVSGVFVSIGLIFIGNIRNNSNKENDKYLSSLEGSHNIVVNNEIMNNMS